MEGISKTFTGVKALDNVSFSVNKGQVHGLVGENGADKSTLMKIMTGVYHADAGEIFIADQKMKIDSVSKEHALGISIIFQELNLCPHLTIKQKGVGMVYISHWMEELSQICEHVSVLRCLYRADKAEHKDVTMALEANNERRS